MKNTMKFSAFVLWAGLLLAGCGSAFHNGTEMAVGTVTVTGLPANPYSDGQDMVFSYNLGSSWIHDDPVAFASARYTATAASGTLTYTFSPPLIITTPTLAFLLIDPAKGWDTFQVDKKHSGKKGGDAVLDNQWTGSGSPLGIVGTVSGDDVTWAFQ